MIPQQFSPADFWSHTLAVVPEVISHDSVTRQWQAMNSSRFGSFAVKRLFESVGLAGWCVVLVIDEFDVLVNHPNFDGEFFGTLRSLAIHTNALAVITASRVSVAEMNRQSLELNPHGSPFFNNFAEVRLIPLSPAECRDLVSTALAPKGVRFSDDDFTLIDALSGRHPYLVQIAASALFDVEASGKGDAARQQAAGALFHDRAAAHFDDVWHHLLHMEQAVLLVLALRELRGRLGKEEFDAGELGDLRWCEASLRYMHEAGMVDRQPDTTNPWRVASRGFVWWVIDNVITRTRDTIILDSRLDEYESRGILSKGHSREVRHLAESIEPGALKGPTEVCRVLLSDSEKVVPPLTSPPAKKFDIFFSYSHADRKAVLRIAKRLERRGIQVWLDVRELRPGFPWQEALETQIKNASAAAVFVGATGIGPWQDMEQGALLRQFVRRKCPVIPVILRECAGLPELPVFLEGMHWVDCRDRTVDPIEHLVHGITGKAP